MRQHANRPGLNGSGLARRTATVLAVCCLAMLVGCGGLWRTTRAGGDLSLHSRAQAGASLEGGFTAGYYHFDDTNHLTAVLLAGPEDAPTRVVTVRMFWRPRAGRTPIDPNATNGTIHYVIFTGGDPPQTGIYSGAGFVYLKSKPGKASLTASVWDATLRLTDHSEGFHDLLGPAEMRGSFTVRRDDAKTDELLRDLNATIEQRLGHRRLVMAK